MIDDNRHQIIRKSVHTNLTQTPNIQSPFQIFQHRYEPKLRNYHPCKLKPINIKNKNKKNLTQTYRKNHILAYEGKEFLDEVLFRLFEIIQEIISQ